MRERVAGEHVEDETVGPVAATARAAPIARLELLQRAIGNRAVGRLLARDPVDTAAPAGVTAGANPLPPSGRGPPTA